MILICFECLGATEDLSSCFANVFEWYEMVEKLAEEKIRNDVINCHFSNLSLGADRYSADIASQSSVIGKSSAVEKRQKYESESEYKDGKTSLSSSLDGERIVFDERRVTLPDSNNISSKAHDRNELLTARTDCCSVPRDADSHSWSVASDSQSSVTCCDDSDGSSFTADDDSHSSRHNDFYKQCERSRDRDCSALTETFGANVSVGSMPTLELSGLYVPQSCPIIYQFQPNPIVKMAPQNQLEKSPIEKNEHFYDDSSADELNSSPASLPSCRLRGRQQTVSLADQSAIESFADEQSSKSPLSVGHLINRPMSRDYNYSSGSVSRDCDYIGGSVTNMSVNSTSLPSMPNIVYSATLPVRRDKVTKMLSNSFETQNNNTSIWERRTERERHKDDLSSDPGSDVSNDMIHQQERILSELFETEHAFLRDLSDVISVSVSFVYAHYITYV